MTTQPTPQTDASLSAEPLPCPFCGSPARHPKSSAPANKTIVACSKHGCILHAALHDENATWFTIKAWNTRAALQSKSAQPVVQGVDEGKLWSLIRSVLSQGESIYLDHIYKDYEVKSARLDAAARERVDDFAPLLSHPAKEVAPPSAAVEANDDDTALRKALDSLDALGDEWMATFNAGSVAENIANSATVKDGILAIMHLSWVEGAYAGRRSLAAFPAALTHVAPPSAEKAVALHGSPYEPLMKMRSLKSLLENNYPSIQNPAVFAKTKEVIEWLEKLAEQYDAAPQPPAQDAGKEAAQPSAAGTAQAVDQRGTFCCPICMKDTPHTHDMRDRWIGVDFDGTLSYDRFERTSPYELGEPIEPMVLRVREWISKGYRVKLLTARMNKLSHLGVERDVEKMRDLLHSWCLKHVGAQLECVANKDGFMEVLWDDRCVQVVRDRGIPVQFAKSCPTAAPPAAAAQDAVRALLPLWNERQIKLGEDALYNASAEVERCHDELEAALAKDEGAK